MKRVSKTEFRDMPSVELGRDGVLEVVSHGTIVGYWVPRDEWAYMQAEWDRLRMEAGEDDQAPVGVG